MSRGAAILVLLLAVGAIGFLLLTDAASDRTAITLGPVDPSPGPGTLQAGSDGDAPAAGLGGMLTAEERAARASRRKPPAPDEMRIQGRVVDEQGRPIAGADVRSRDYRKPRWLGVGKVRGRGVITAADGSFKLNTLRRAYHVEASAAGYMSVALPNVGPHAPLVIQLPRATCRVRGVVRRPDGTPASFALVRCFSYDAVQATALTRANADGAYVLGVTPGQGTAIHAWSTGCLDARTLCRAPDEGEDIVVDIDLQAGIPLSGRVTDEATGKGIPGATIDTQETVGPVLRSGKDGFFRGTLTSNRTRQAHAAARGYQPSSPQPYVEHPEGGRTLEIKLRARPLDRAGGQVLDADGTPVRGAHVALSGGGYAVTTTNGRFQIALQHRVGNSAMILTARHPDHGVAIHVLSATDKPVVLTLQPTGSLAGRVTVAGGGHPEDAIVTVSSTGLEGSAASGHTVLMHLDLAYGHAVAADGSFAVRGLPPGTYRVSVAHGRRGGVPTDAGAVLIRAGEHVRGIDVELPRTRVIAGTVRDEAGQPISHALVRIGVGGRSNNMLADAQGRFEMRGLTGRDISVAAFKAGYTHATAGGSPAAMRRVDLVLKRVPRLLLSFAGATPPAGQSLMVNVVHADGRPGGGGEVAYLGGEVTHALDASMVGTTIDIYVTGFGVEGGPVRVTVASPERPTLVAMKLKAVKGTTPMTGVKRAQDAGKRWMDEQQRRMKNRRK